MSKKDYIDILMERTLSRGRKSKLSLSIKFPEEMRDDIIRALTCFKNTPREITDKRILDFMVKNFTPNDNFVSESNIEVSLPLITGFVNTPPRNNMVSLRNSGYLEGTYTKEKGRNSKFAIYYNVDKLIVRLSELANEKIITQLLTQGEWEAREVRLEKSRKRRKELAEEKLAWKLKHPNKPYKRKRKNKRGRPKGARNKKSVIPNKWWEEKRQREKEKAEAKLKKEILG